MKSLTRRRLRKLAFYGFTFPSCFVLALLAYAAERAWHWARQPLMTPIAMLTGEPDPVALGDIENGALDYGDQGGLPPLILRGGYRPADIRHASGVMDVQPSPAAFSASQKLPGAVDPLAAPGPFGWRG